ncbi:PREDICTED: uncharacterized protein LOC104739042 [Camelina sativa]|uniref:Uncharacterized protein LOC104739042 n=1 Tax=Camelina sativa TaxID=90675 RepID=A0ABM0VKH8_CAMSA|nr:PREDICTED: uncharacterized protein LOC104739042 [Camelina sativa]
MPRIVMRRLVADFADRDEFVCSIYDLEKKIKKNLERNLEKERKKELKRLKSLPPISQLRTGIATFWSSFLLDSTTTLLDYAQSKPSSFPDEFMNDFMRRIRRAGWYQEEKNLDYTVPRRVLDRLAATYSQPVDMVEDPFTLIALLESRVEAEQAREEAYRRRQEMVLRKHEEKQANHAKKMEEKAEKEALNKAIKEKKRIAKQKNQMARIGAKSCGLT